MGKLHERAVPDTEPPSGARFIALTRGKFAIVDEEDFELLSTKPWHAYCQYKIWYACRKVQIGSTRTTISMHRHVLGASEDQLVDHINRDGLDNRKSNLRYVTVSQNRNNASSARLRAGKRKGVSFVSDHPRTKPWRAALRTDNNSIRLGFFKTEDEAARRYDSAARFYFGEFAHVNFPDDVAPFDPRPRERILSSTGYIGVAPKGAKFVAGITVAGRFIRLGSFPSPIDAARAYDNAAATYRGSEARLNFSK